MWLYKKEGALEGQIREISVYDGKEELKKVPRWYEDQFKRLGVQVELNREVTSRMIEELKPDVAILAKGAKSIIPDVPGIYRENVVTAVDVLAGKCQAGERVAVMGSGMVGI